MNYQEMSESEINYSVARAKFKSENVKLTCRGKGDVIVLRELGDGSPSVFNPCNSWADAGPIIEEHKISVIHDCMAEPQDGGCWLARPTYGYEHENARSDNPLRAAMIVFLMMKGGE